VAHLDTELRNALRPYGMQELGKRLLDVFNQHRPDEMLWALCDLVIAGAKRGGMIEPSNEREEAAMVLLEPYERAVRDNPPLTDLLAALYMAITSRWKGQGLGQFFTPADVCDLMAAMQLADLGSDTPDRRLRIMDPCCGSGAMLLAAGRQVLAKGGSELLSYFSFTGTDLDPICVRMCATQWIANAALHDARPGEIILRCGNSLTAESEHKTILWAEHPRWVSAARQNAA
jgi:hypothetical protein